MPPQYALLNEAPIEPDYNKRVVETVAVIQEYSIDSPRALDLLCREGITHIYIGQGQGLIGAEAKQLYAPTELLQSPAFSSLYHQDRVWIFAFDRTRCGGEVK
jgi:hypothetical protein